MSNDTTIIPDSKDRIQVGDVTSVTELPMSAITARRLIWFGFIMTVLTAVLNAAVGSSLFARWPTVIQVFGFAGTVTALLSHYFNRRAPSSSAK